MPKDVDLGEKASRNIHRHCTTSRSKANCELKYIRNRQVVVAVFPEVGVNFNRWVVDKSMN
jgi:hypothetical protein